MMPQADDDLEMEIRNYMQERQYLSGAEKYAIFLAVPPRIYAQLQL